jgi:Tfp pilus assembly protein FimV
MTAISVHALPAMPRTARPARLRLTRRGRAVLTALAALPLVVAALVLGINAGGAVATDGPGAPLETVTVDGGQSLWDIAADVAPDADPREFASDVMHLNQLATPTLQPGQVLAIPSEYTD